MATVVAWTDLMPNYNIRPTDPTAAIRFAAWILPPHRKDWAEAMLNEIAYVSSRRAALRWTIGCTFFAVRERASYELVTAFTTRRIVRTLLGLSAALVFTVIGVYMVQKPYQRERIRIMVRHSFGASTPSHTGAVQ